MAEFSEFVDSIITYIQDINPALVVIAIGFIIALIYSKWKVNKRKEEEQKKIAQAKEEEDNAPTQPQQNFNTLYLQQDFVKMNLMPNDKLSFLKKRRDKIKQEIEESIDTFNKAKKQYNELVQIGKSLNHAIEVLKQEEARYDEQIAGLEHGRKNKT